jgi:hypothetical protein
MRRALAIVLAAVAAMSLLGVGAAVAGQETWVSGRDCSHLAQEPRKILFACADGGYYADHLEWSSWEVRRAEGRGVFHFNDCDPNCAGGTFHRRTGGIVLHDRTWCEEPHRFVFNRARITYDRPYQGSRRNDYPLGCPLSP